MSQELLNVLRVAVLGEQNGGGGMPEVIEPEGLREPGALESRLEGSGQVALVRGVPTLEGKTRS